MPKETKSQQNQCWIYSCTYFGSLEQQPMVHSALKRYAKKFVYQLEECPTTKNHHFQIYLNLKDKDRAKSLAAKLSGCGMSGNTCKVASDEGKTALQSYCMKSETRVEGPWADHAIYCGQDLIKQLRPWQQDIFDMIKSEPDRRKIYWYTDTKGGAGKSSFAKWLYYHHDILCLTFADAKDLLNIVYKLQGKPCYLFDLSRTKGGKTSMSDIYQALESVKNGYFINSKYETGVACYAIPHVIVFANKNPDYDALSSDRWVVQQMST